MPRSRLKCHTRKPLGEKKNAALVVRALGQSQHNVFVAPTFPRTKCALVYRGHASPAWPLQVRGNLCRSSNNAYIPHLEVPINVRIFAAANSIYNRQNSYRGIWNQLPYLGFALILCRLYDAKIVLPERANINIKTGGKMKRARKCTKKKLMHIRINGSTETVL